MLVNCAMVRGRTAGSNAGCVTELERSFKGLVPCNIPLQIVALHTEGFFLKTTPHGVTCIPGCETRLYASSRLWCGWPAGWTTHVTFSTSVSGYSWVRHFYQLSGYWYTLPAWRISGFQLNVIDSLQAIEINEKASTSDLMLLCHLFKYKVELLNVCEIEE